MSALRRIASRAGVDSAIAWNLAPQVFAALAGPALVLLLTTQLSADDQGFYFAFTSLVGSAVLLELGLTTALAQVVAHERAQLRTGPGGALLDDGLHKGRLRALVAGAGRRYCATAGLLTLLLATAGTGFLASGSPQVSGWVGPWLALSVLAGLALLAQLAYVLVEACGEVARSARARALAAVSGTTATGAALLAGGRLWSPAVGLAVSTIGGLALVLPRLRRTLADLRDAADSPFSWRREVWPFQWRVAVTTAAGFATAQAFVPILFAARGTRAAGRMGLSLLLVNAVVGLAMTWLVTRRAAFSTLAAHGQVAELDRVWGAAARRSLAVSTAGCTALLALAAAAGAVGLPVAHRVLDLPALSLLCLGMLLTQVQWAQSAYLRAYKEEALLKVRVWSSVLSVAAVAAAVPRFGELGQATAFAAVASVVSLGAGTRVFRRRRTYWRSLHAV